MVKFHFRHTEKKKAKLWGRRVGQFFEKQSLNKKPLSYSDHSLICAACEKMKSDIQNRGEKLFTKYKLSPKRLRQVLLDEQYALLTSLSLLAVLYWDFVLQFLNQNFHKQSLRTCWVVLEYQPKSSSVGVCFSSPRCCLATGRWEKIASSYIQDN